jgi:putative membrane protein insertion efficiency factor
MAPLRRASWILGAPARALLMAGIRVYRATLSGWLGGQCRFYPTCSHYAEEAIRSRGAVAGSAFAAWRILRCNPFGAGGIDHAPSPLGGRRSAAKYDGVVHSGEAVGV